jgi:hypothetical protein
VPSIPPSCASSSTSRNKLPSDAELDELDLQAFVDARNTQSDVYSDAENGTINCAIEVNVKRLADTRWKPLASFHHACKQFTLMEIGGDIAVGRVEVSS